MNETGFDSAAIARMSLTDLVNASERAKAERGVAASIGLYEAWLALNGDQPIAYLGYFNLGVAYNEAADTMKAAKAFREGVRVQPGFAPLRINLGRALENLDQPQAAIDQWRLALDALSGVTGEAVERRVLLLTQSARLLQHHLRDAAAEPLLTEAIDLDPHHEAAVREWLGLRTRTCKWPAISATSRVSVERQRGYIWPLSLAALADDPIFQLARACRHARTEFARPTAAQLTRVQTARKPRATGRSRIKIGYVSSDLREHPVGLGLCQVFEKHDRDRFETHAYYCGIEREDATKTRLRAAVEHWLDISKMSDEAAAMQIARDGIDILVDLNGYTKFARTPLFALKPAPVQVNWFGYPSTMGTPYHHYLIADEAIIPRGDEIFYSEEVLRLPCYQPNDRLRMIAETTPKRADFGLPDGAFVFCSFNATQKLTQRSFDLWLTILKSAPGAVLWMLEGTPETHDRLTQYAQNAGVEQSRLIWARKLPNPEHLARYPLADLFLDSFPWGAHTTASDALWQGVPILTQTGRTFAARVCTSLVRAAGAPELACETEEEYVGKAVAFTQNRPALEALRARLRAARDSSVLFDIDRLVRALEGVYAEMAKREAQGRTPRPDLTNLEIYHEIGVKLDIEATNRLSRDAYMQAYRDALAEVDMHEPLAADARLWRRDEAEKRAASGA
jgi:predicted O-linked N-acetylglucosamine transferase (SPINDLY family)